MEEMEEKRLKYTLTALSKNDKPSMRGRGWEDVFGTSDPVEVERRYKQSTMHKKVTTSWLCIVYFSFMYSCLSFQYR